MGGGAGTGAPTAPLAPRHRPRPGACWLQVDTRARLPGMARHGPIATLSNRRDITIRCDRNVYDDARALIEHLPGVALSDVVESFLREFIEHMTPLVAQLQTVTTREAALPIMERFAAETIGQGMIEFTRASRAFLAEEGEKDKG